MNFLRWEDGRGGKKGGGHAINILLSLFDFATLAILGTHQLPAKANTKSPLRMCHPKAAVDILQPSVLQMDCKKH